ATEFPPNDVVVAVHKDLPSQVPDVVEFLSQYETNNDLTEEALKYMDENDASPEEAAEWWMEEHEDLWTSWVDDEVAEKVKDALEERMGSWPLRLVSCFFFLKEVASSQSDYYKKKKRGDKAVCLTAYLWGVFRTYEQI